MKTFCPNCKRAYPPGWHAAVRKRQSENIKKALSASNTVGRMRKVNSAQVIALRASGLSWKHIAETLNISRGAAQYAVRVPKARRT